MEFMWLEKEIFYDGSQLRSHWIREVTGIGGDAIVSFRGGCDVSSENMVDLEDKFALQKIRAKVMLHFISEIFHVNLREIHLWQRLLVSLVKDALEEKSFRTKRLGNDLFHEGKKMSVSIATVSPISGLIHLGINIDPEGAPVNASKLPEDINVKDFALEICGRFVQEHEDFTRGIKKVRWVR